MMSRELEEWVERKEEGRRSEGSEGQTP